MEFFEVAEIELQKQLKDLCDIEGKETNIHESARIFNKLGLLYKTKRTDKIKLIQSSALLNAAIVRKPSDQGYQNDLRDLCKHVLSCSGAEQKDADLVGISQTSAKQIKEMRQKVCIGLKEIKPISKALDQPRNLLKESMKYVELFRFLQEDLTEDYKRIMVNISQQCFRIMGTLPCRYALIGMGSLAKNEITPYSDFEHVLALENLHQLPDQKLSQIKEYFRWYSTIFHIIVINLQETDLYSVCIPCLNDHSTPGGNWFYDNITCQGISFDGMMPHACHFPLGKTQETTNQPWTTELIQPVDEMVKYLAVKDLKKGYKLGDLLTKTCFVDGDVTIYQQFSAAVKSTLKETHIEQQANIKQQLHEDLERFDSYQNLSMFRFNKSINIKAEIYRSITLFLSALGRLQEFDTNSSFEIIEKLRHRNTISEDTAQKLYFSIAVVCHIRLSYYSSSERQKDDIYHETESWGVQKLEELTKFVSMFGLINSWTTGSVLQQMSKDFLEIKNFDKLFKRKRIPAQMTILNLIGLFKDTIEGGEIILLHHKKLGVDLHDVLYHLGVAYIRTKQFMKCIEMHDKHAKELVPSFGMKLNELESLFHLKNFELLASESDAVLKSKNYQSEREFGFLLHLNGVGKFNLKNYHQALSAFRDVRRYNKSNKSWFVGVDQAVVIRYVSLCLIGLGKVEQGLHWAREGYNYLGKIQATEVCFKWFTSIFEQHQRPTTAECNP